MPAGLDAVAAGLEADQPHVGVVEERVEDPDRVGAAADAGGDGVGQPPGALEHLLAGLQADDAVEVADHRRERVRARDGAEQVVGVVRRVDTQSRSASLIASLRVREPVVTGITSAPSSRMRATLSAWRSVSTSPM